MTERVRIMEKDDFGAQKQAMGIDWDVTLPELSNAVPPAFTKHIGEYLMNHLSTTPTSQELANG